MGNGPHVFLNKEEICSGFTLIELTIVIIVISIIAVNSFFMLPNASSVNVYGQAIQLGNDIRYTQALSMSSGIGGQRYYLKISGSTYQIINALNSQAIPLRNGSTVSLGSGITFGTIVNLPNNLIEFNNFGIPYTTSTTTGGTLLAATASIPLTGGGSTSTVSVSPETGTVAIQ